MDGLQIRNIGGLDCYEENGVAYLNLEQAARGLGFTRIAASGNAVVRWERVNGYLREFGFVPTSGHGDFIPENIFYRLAMKAKNEAAERFQAWVADEVIPSIRKHGAYMTPETLEAALLNPDTLIRLATELKAERERRQALEANNAALQKEIAAFAPVKSYYEQILSSMGTMTTTQIAADYGISARELNKILHDERIQWKTNGQWVLYREHMGKGYTQSVTIPIVRSDGTNDTKMHTQWTQKGRLLIHDILTRRGFRANVDLEAGT